MHKPHKRIERGLKSTLFGIFVNAALALVKGVTGYLGNSYALIADAIESASDVFSSTIVWGGLKVASIPRDHNHPYGHGKAEPLAAIVVSIALFAAAFSIAIHSVVEIITPHHSPAPYTLIVLGVVIVVKEILFRYIIKIGEEVHSTAVKTDAWHHRSDAITSAAAFIGISIALIGGEKYASADDYAALFASVIILYNAFKLFKPALDEIMDIAPSPEIEKSVRAIAGAVEGVIELDKCFVRKMGLEYYVDLHVVVNGDVSVREGHEIGHKVKDSICSSNSKIVDVLVHIEPHTFDNG
ncbi:MAG: cation transporter [Ignavibacteriaceae bacterium]|nr:cation transporter [Ignavibacteriaceae bacterium]